MYATTAEVVASGSKCPFVTAFVFGFHLFKCPKDTHETKTVRNLANTAAVFYKIANKLKR